MPANAYLATSIIFSVQIMHPHQIQQGMLPQPTAASKYAKHIKLYEDVRIIIFVELLFEESSQIFNGHRIVASGQSLLPADKALD